MIINTNHLIINMTTNDGLEFISRYNCHSVRILPY